MSNKIKVAFPTNRTKNRTSFKIQNTKLMLKVKDFRLTYKINVSYLVNNIKNRIFSKIMSRCRISLIYLFNNNMNIKNNYSGNQFQIFNY